MLSFEPKNKLAKMYWTQPLSFSDSTEKVFDTVSYNILLHKLNHYEVRGTEGNWFKSYLQSWK